MAQGEFLAFLDADDLWHPEKLARQMARFQDRPELDLCITHVELFWIPELQEEEAWFRRFRPAHSLPGYVMQTVLARRNLFKTVGHFNTGLKVGEDTDWFLRAEYQGAVMDLLPDVLVRRRFHQTNYTRRNRSARRDCALKIVKASLDRRHRHERATPAPLKFPKSNWRERT